jgi:hypothetical protein
MALVVVVTPVPILLLLFLAAVTKILVLAMGFIFPPAVEDHFIVVPNVFIIIVTVVNTIPGRHVRVAAAHQNRGSEYRA